MSFLMLRLSLQNTSWKCQSAVLLVQENQSYVLHLWIPFQRRRIEESKSTGNDREEKIANSVIEFGAQFPIHSSLLTHATVINDILFQKLSELRTLRWLLNAGVRYCSGTLEERSVYRIYTELIRQLFERVEIATTGLIACNRQLIQSYLHY